MVRNNRKRAGSETSLYKRRALFFSILAVALFLSLYIAAPVAIGTSDTDIMQIGNMTTTLTLTTVALDENGNQIESLSPNSPLYAGEIAVWSFKAYIDFRADGEDIDWTTYDLDINLEVNGLVIETWNLGPGESDWTYHHATITHEIDGLDRFTGEENVYVRAQAQVDFQDNAGNHLDAQDMALNAWTFTGDSGGGTPGGDPVSPSFYYRSNDQAYNQGESLNLEWEPTDDNPTTYIITTYTIYDGWDIRKTGTWEDGQILSWDPKSFLSTTAGTYELKVTCVIEDEDENAEYSTIILTTAVLVPPEGPSFLSPKSSGITSAATYTNDADFIKFYPSSPIPMSYRIYHDGLEIDSGNWGGEEIVIFIDTWNYGMNKIKCTVFDDNGFFATTTHTISVYPYIAGGGSGGDVGGDIDDTGTGDPKGVVNSPFSTGGGISMLIATIIIMLIAGYFTIKWMVEN